MARSERISKTQRSRWSDRARGGATRAAMRLEGWVERASACFEEIRSAMRCVSPRHENAYLAMATGGGAGGAMLTGGAPTGATAAGGASEIAAAAGGRPGSTTTLVPTLTRM